jgi:hypothetical protein
MALCQHDYFLAALKDLTTQPPFLCFLALINRRRNRNTKRQNPIPTPNVQSADGRLLNAS